VGNRDNGPVRESSIPLIRILLSCLPELDGKVALRGTERCPDSGTQAADLAEVRTVRT